MTDLNRIIDYIEKTDMIDPNKSFEYAKICSQFLRDPLKEEDGRKIIINFLNKVWDIC